MITPVTPVREPKPKRPATWKFLVMGGLTVLFAGIFWWTLRIALGQQFIGLPPVSQLLQVGIALVFFCVTLAFFGVLAMVVGKAYWWVTAIVSVLSAGLLIPFFPLRWATLIAAGVTLVGFLVWSWNIAGDVQSRKKFQPHYTIHAGFGTGLVLLLIGVSMCYYASLGATSQTAEQLRQNLISAARQGIDLYLPHQVPNYSGSMTLDQFLSQVASDKFGQYVIPQLTQTISSDADKQKAYDQITDALRKVNPAFGTPQVASEVQKQLDQQLAEQRAQLQENAIAQLSAAQQQLLVEARREFLATFRIEAAGTDTMDTVIEKILTRNVTKYVDPYQHLLPPLLALSFFFAIELISIVYRYVIFFLAPVIAWLYRKGKLLRVVEKPATVQSLEL